jgi:hypothetical protein
MLKITSIDEGNYRILVLEGKLIDPWIEELEKTWGESQRVSGGKVFVDLKDVTSISQRGENLLYRMMVEGATFSCCRGVLTRHVVSRLEHRREIQNREAKQSR